MNWNKWLRQSHRWLSVVFTVLVIANIVVNVIPLAQEQLTLWVGFVTLLPLVLLLLTGLYLFVLPYTTKWRSERRTAETGDQPA
jgi:hypothetical protein